MAEDLRDWISTLKGFSEVETIDCKVNWDMEYDLSRLMNTAK